MLFFNKIKLFKYNFYFILILILVSCSTSKEITTTEKEEIIEKSKTILQEVNLNIQKNICWVNLMPGSEPKFNISGKYRILESEDYNFKTIVMKYVKVFQNGNEIYLIKPKVIEELGANSKLITFSTLQGLTVNKLLNLTQLIDLEFVFFDNEEKLVYQLKKIEIEEII